MGMIKINVLAGLLVCSFLGGCGGGGGTTTSGAATVSSITGLAATGAAIANGTVSLKCASGAASGSTAADGYYTIALNSGQTLPCIVRVVSNGIPSVTLYSFTAQYGRVNITPLTDLVVASAFAGNPDTAFGNFSTTTGSTIATHLGAAQTYVNGTLLAAGLGTPANDLLSGAFAVGDGTDQMLDSIAAALITAAKTQADLRTAASTGVALASVTGPFVKALPAIASFSPANGLAGSSVTISGTGFSTTAANNKVHFATGTADVAAGLGTVTSATATQLVVTVPAAAVSGPISIFSASLAQVLSVATAQYTVNSGGTGGGTSAGTLTASNAVSSIGNGTIAFTTATSITGPLGPQIRATGADSLLVINYAAGTGSISTVLYYWGHVANVNGSDFADHVASCTPVSSTCGVSISNGTVAFANTVLSTIASPSVTQAMLNGTLAVSGLSGIVASSTPLVSLNTSACSSGALSPGFGIAYYAGCGATAVSDFSGLALKALAATSTCAGSLTKSGAILTLAVTGGSSYTVAYNGESADTVVTKNVSGAKELSARTGYISMQAVFSADLTQLQLVQVADHTNSESSPAILATCGAGVLN